MLSTISQRTILAGRLSSPKTRLNLLSNITTTRTGNAASFPKPCVSINLSSHRFFSVFSKEEEEAENKRVGGLSKYQKEIELRDLDKELSRLNTLRGINSGELYTFRGKFKALARDYGVGFMAWYWFVWMSTGAMTYGAITMGAIDPMVLIENVDAYTGLELSSKVDPQLGAIGITLVFNEMLEPIRLPIVVMTTKPIVEALYPKTY